MMRPKSVYTVIKRETGGKWCTQRVSIPSSKEEREENGVPKECLYRHQKRNGRKMVYPKSVYAIIKRGTGGK
ncbi:hypothetical protein ACOJQI_18255 [Bacillus salacetis]|uniref:hypothetical protein n=1 Tax=Bacillus salacetis TaxID=2315464 RepID=UPI003BA076A4